MANDFMVNDNLWFSPLAGDVFATEQEAKAASKEAKAVSRELLITQTAEARIAERLAALIDEGSDSDSLWMAPVAGKFFPTQVEAICANERAIADRDYEEVLVA